LVPYSAYCEEGTFKIAGVPVFRLAKFLLMFFPANERGFGRSEECYLDRVWKIYEGPNFYRQLLIFHSAYFVTNESE